MFVLTQPHTVVTAHPLSNSHGCEKAAFMKRPRSCVFEAEKSCVFKFSKELRCIPLQPQRAAFERARPASEAATQPLQPARFKT